MSKIKVLFLCSSNSARSQMAEAFLRNYAGDRFEAYSAGLEPKEIHPLTYRVMSEAGLDISGHHITALKDLMGRVHFGYLITVCSEAEKNCPSTFPGMGHRLFWDIEDPAAFLGTEEEKLQKFREVRDIIRERVTGWADTIPG